MIDEAMKEARAAVAASEMLDLMVRMEEDGALSREDIETAVFAVTYMCICDRSKNGELKKLQAMKDRAEQLAQGVEPRFRNAAS